MPPQCDECGGPLIEHNGELVCAKCGLVSDRILVDSSYSDPLGRSSHGTQHVFIARTDTPLPLLGSVIGFSNSRSLHDSKGHKLSEEKVVLFEKLKQYDRNSVHYNKSTHKRTIRIFYQVANSLHLRPSIIDATLHKYKKLSEKYEGKITNHILLLVLCLTLVVRELGHKAPLSMSEIVDAFKRNGNRVSSKSLLRLARELNISLKGQYSRKSEDYVFRIVSTLKNHEKIQYRIRKHGFSVDEYCSLLQRTLFSVLGRVDHTIRGGKRPYTFAVTLAYLIEQNLASLQHRQPILSQVLTAEATGVAEFTIRDHTKALRNSGIHQIIGYVLQKILKQTFDTT